MAILVFRQLAAHAYPERATLLRQSRDSSTTVTPPKAVSLVNSICWRRDGWLWKAHGECHPGAGPALDAHARLMAGEDMLDDGEAEAGAAMAAADLDVHAVEA